jgi:hypothetical protein
VLRTLIERPLLRARRSMKCRRHSPRSRRHKNKGPHERPFVVSAVEHHWKVMLHAVGPLKALVLTL